MPLMSRNNKWPIQSEEMRHRLGFPHKLPDNKEPIVVMMDGWQVTILPRTDTKRKKHRIVIQCAYCDRLIPFGRLAQHEPACLRKES